MVFLLTGPPQPPIMTPLENPVKVNARSGETGIFFMFLQHTPPGTGVYWEVPRPNYFNPHKRLGRDQFFRTNTNLTNGVKQEIHEGRAYMFLKDVTIRDSGTYICRVVTPWGLSTTQAINLFVGKVY